MKSSIEVFFVTILVVLGSLGVGLPRIDGFGENQTNALNGDQTHEEELAQEEVKNEPSEEIIQDTPSQDDAEEASEEPIEEPEPALADMAKAPVVDIMRFDGNLGIVSGMAAAGSTILIMDGDQEIARTTADATGEFAASFDFKTPAEGAILQVISEDETGNRLAASEALTVLPQDTGETATASLTNEGVEVAAPKSDQLALGQLSYGATDPISFGGTAAANAIVEIFVNSEKVGEAQADQSGAWSYEMNALPEGNYDIALLENGERNVLYNVDILTETKQASQDGNEPEGSVSQEQSDNEDAADSEETTTALIEGNDKTIASEANASADATTENGVTAQKITIENREYIVQRGDSLWRIAERFYGEGTRYTEIFDINAGEINNPDLIFPDQEFKIPGEN